MMKVKNVKVVFTLNQLKYETMLDIEEERDYCMENGLNFEQWIAPRSVQLKDIPESDTHFLSNFMKMIKDGPHHSWILDTNTFIEVIWEA